MIDNNCPLQPFSKAAYHFLVSSDAFLNLAVGSIRSGKTIVSIVCFLAFMGESPHTSFAIAGKTINSLRRNVIKPFLEILDYFNESYVYNRAEQVIHVGNKDIYLFGIDKVDAEDKIKGSTFAGALLDEVTTMPENGFQMMLSRNSLSGARIFATCNPSNPNHYIYTDYVCNPHANVKTFQFRLEDNNTLTDEYIHNVKSMYDCESVFYKRNILGEWVSGQGAIFDSFTDDNIIHGDINLDDYYRFGIGSDYGTSTTTAYSPIGFKDSPDGTVYTLLSEHYFDAQREGRSQADDERVDDIVAIQDYYHFDASTTFWCSHDAESLKVALLKDERVRMDIDTFMPDTLDCIRRMNTLFHQNRLLIHESCTETIKQIQSYEWDLRASSKGVDKPVKVDDHLVDSLRAPIMQDITGHKVWGDVVYL
ncbi:MAG: hypothetical protein BZ138_07405 [Methanosphaera sp. rholeuAM270]|nr:MAG: hypothetical protein BZ138_07405 [Methanosphaera sp. rholeuAM270]